MRKGRLARKTAKPARQVPAKKAASKGARAATSPVVRSLTQGNRHGTTCDIMLVLNHRERNSIRSFVKQKQRLLHSFGMLVMDSMAG